MIFIPDMKVTRIQMTEMISKNSCPQKTSIGELYNSIPSYFFRMVSSNQTYNSHVDYSIKFVPVLLIPLPENQVFLLFKKGQNVTTIVKQSQITTPNNINLNRLVSEDFLEELFFGKSNFFARYSSFLFSFLLGRCIYQIQRSFS